MHFRLLAAPAAVLLLAGCQALQKPVAATQQPDPAIVRVVAQQQVLWQEGALDAKRPLPSDPIQFDGDRLQVAWSGDAVELLSHLAKQRGLSFFYSGVRLPLPVNIRAEGITYENLLQLIVMQTAWRATLKQHPGQLSLVFAQVQAQERSGDRQ